MGKSTKDNINKCIEKIKEEYNRDAVYELHTLIGASIRYIAFNYAKNSVDAEDLVQDFWANIFEIAKGFRYNTNGKSYLLKVMTNRSINAYQKRKRETEAYFAMATPEDSKTVDENTVVKDIYNKTLIEKCFAKLTEQEKFIIKETYFLDKTVRDIAEEMNISKSVVSKIKQKALRIMAKVIAASDSVDKLR